jgi:Flp pilus assembly protein TadD
MNAVRRVPKHWAVAAVLAAMVVAVYGRAGSFPFITLDDKFLILRNTALQGGLSLSGLRWAFTTDMDAGWIPLTWLSRMLDVSLFGMDAGKHHLANVLFHLLNALLLFHVLRKMTGKTWESGFVAALFAVHPLHVESVAWVTERKDVLGAFFWMLSIGAYARYAERPGVVRYGLVVLIFSLGLMSKAILVTLPFVLLLLDYWPLGRLRPSGEPRGDGDVSPSFDPASPGRLLVEKVPLFVLSAAVSVVTFLAQKNIGAVVPLGATPLWVRAGNALQSYAAYLRKAAWPSDLAVFYPHPLTNLSLWKTAAAGLFLCLVTALVVRQARRRGWLAVGWFWYLGTLVPVIGLVQVGGPGMADRCAYIPLIGVYVMVAWGMGESAARFGIPKPATAAVAVVWLLALLACAWVQVGYWRSDTLLFRRALVVTKDNWMAHNSLGEAAHEAGRDEEAVAHYREALRIWPGSPEVHNDLGVALFKLGRHGEAISHFREALRIRPGHPEAHNNLGVHLSDIGRDEEAVAHYREALRIRPDYAEAHHNLGMALARSGMSGEATGHLRRAVRLRPDYAEAHNNLGVLLARQGAYSEAVSEFREALRLKPDYAGARHNLDRALEDSGLVRPEEGR